MKAWKDALVKVKAKQGVMDAISTLEQELVVEVLLGVLLERWPELAAMAEATGGSEPPCAFCADIQRQDSLRHFTGCPRRKDLPTDHPAATGRVFDCFDAFLAGMPGSAWPPNACDAVREAIETVRRELDPKCTCALPGGLHAPPCPKGDALERQAEREVLALGRDVVRGEGTADELMEAFRRLVPKCQHGSAGQVTGKKSHCEDCAKSPGSWSCGCGCAQCYRARDAMALHIMTKGVRVRMIHPDTKLVWPGTVRGTETSKIGTEYAHVEWDKELNTANPFSMVQIAALLPIEAP